jgi:acyl-CoA synthetase (AMP-forming)/AMP-acid ligase II
MAIEALITKERIAKYTKAGFWGEETILDFLDRNCRMYADNEVFVEDNKRTTFGELQRNIDRLALSFLEMGIKKETIVGVQLHNCVEFVCIYYALSKIGAITLPIHTPLRKRDIEDIIARFHCQYIIAPDKYRGFDFLEMYEWILSTNSQLKSVIIVGKKVNKGMFNFDDFISHKLDGKYPADYLLQFKPSPNDINAIFLTSGTTGGKIKGVMWTLNMFTHQGRAFNESYLNSHNDTVLYMGPFTHIAFILALNAYTLLGAKVMTVNDMDLKKGIQVIPKEKATILMAVPAQFARMMDDPLFKKTDVSSLRTVISFGSACPPEVVKRVREEMKCHFNLWYATSEGGYTTTKWGLPLKTQQETVGSPQRGTEWKIINGSGETVPTGQQGEVCINGPVRSAGYYNDPELNKLSFDKEGWFHTGDLGLFDEDGNLHITGRIKDLIIRGGENILPAELENEIYEHPSVESVAVISMPDPVLGERVCAYVKLRTGVALTLDEIRNFLTKKDLAYYKLPERLELIDVMPFNDLGKVKKFELKKDLEERMKGGK